MIRPLAAYRALAKRFVHARHGGTAIEYALIGGLIFVVIVGSIRAYTTNMSGVYSNIEDAIVSAAP